MAGWRAARHKLSCSVVNLKVSDNCAAACLIVVNLLLDEVSQLIYLVHKAARFVGAVHPICGRIGNGLLLSKKYVLLLTLWLHRNLVHIIFVALAVRSSPVPRMIILAIILVRVVDTALRSSSVR